MINKSLQQWVDDLSQVELPALAQTHAALRAIEHAPNVSGADIAEVVMHDPMMVLKAMRMVNSGRGSRFSQPVVTVEHAAMMLGMSASFRQLLSCPIAEEAMAPEACTGLLAVVSRAFHAAFHARDWARLRLDINVEEVYNAALLQELAAMVLWVQAPDSMRICMQLAREKGSETAEQEIFGFPLDALTLQLAQVWNLPPLGIAALVPEECALHVRPRLVSLAKRLARDVERGWYDMPLRGDVAGLADTLRVGVDDILARIHRVSAAAARASIFGDAPPAGRWLPLLPGPWPDESVPAAPADQSPSPADPFQAALSRMAAHQDGTLTLNELMQVVLKGMRDGIGLKRLVFALPTQDRTQVRARFVVGAQEGEALKGFQFALGTPTLFGKLMEKQQAFWLNDETRVNVQALLDSETVRITQARQFFAMTVAVRGKVVGMFYADAGEGEQTLRAQGYDQFKQLCTQAALVMAHLAKS